MRAVGKQPVYSPIIFPPTTAPYSQFWFSETLYSSIRMATVSLRKSRETVVVGPETVSNTLLINGCI